MVALVNENHTNVRLTRRSQRTDSNIESVARDRRLQLHQWPKQHTKFNITNNDYNNSHNHDNHTTNLSIMMSETFPAMFKKFLYWHV